MQVDSKHDARPKAVKKSSKKDATGTKASRTKPLHDKKEGAKPKKTKRVDQQSKKPSGVKDAKNKSTKQDKNKKEKQKQKPKAALPPPPPSILDDVEDDHWVGQFTRASRFCKTSKDNHTLQEPAELIDPTGIPNYDPPDIDESYIERITNTDKDSKGAPASWIRFSRKSVRLIQLASQSILTQKNIELKVLSDMQGRQTMSIDTVMGNLKQQSEQNIEHTQMMRQLEIPLMNQFAVAAMNSAPHKSDENKLTAAAWKTLAKTSSKFDVDEGDLKAYCIENFDTSDAF
jgi:hypothetical protein